MTQDIFKEQYYNLLNLTERRSFRMEMCRCFEVEETDLYRRMRLGHFTALEWREVSKYMNEHPLNKEYIV